MEFIAILKREYPWTITTDSVYDHGRLSNLEMDTSRDIVLLNKPHPS